MSMRNGWNDCRITEPFERSYKLYVSTEMYLNGAMSESEFEREICIKYEKDSVVEGKWIIKIDVRKETIWGTKLTGAWGKIIKKMSAVTHLTHFDYGEQGDALALTNWEEIKAQWKAIKEELLKDYTSADLYTMFEGLTNRIEDRRALTGSLLEYGLFGTILNLIHVHYEEPGRNEVHRPFNNFFENSEVVIKEVRTLTPLPKSGWRIIKPEDMDEKMITITGEIEQCNVEALGLWLHSKAGIKPGEAVSVDLKEYKGKCVLDIKTNEVETFQLDCLLQVDSCYWKKLSYKLISC